MADSCAAGRMTGPHVMAQLAGCQRAVGIALSPRPRLLELRGPAPELERMVGQLGGVASADCVRWRCGWWQREGRHRLLVLADPSRQADFDRLLAFVTASFTDVTVRNVSTAVSSLVLVGPLAARLAVLPAAREAGPVMVVAENEHCRLLVLPASRAPDAKRALLDAGRDDGALAVDVSTANLYRAAQRIRAPRRPVQHRPSVDPTLPGALLP